MANQSRDFLTQFHVENGITSADFMKIWKNYDADNNGFIEKEELDRLADDLLNAGKGNLSSDTMKLYKKHILQICDTNNDNRLDLKEASHLFKIEDPSTSSADMPKEVFLGHFRTTTGLHSADFIKIWKKYDADKNGYIESSELDCFLKDLMKEKYQTEGTASLEEYKKKILQYYDKNNDGKLDLKEMFELLPIEENFLAKFTGPKTTGDFNQIFAHYDQNNDQVISGDELLGFMKDFMESMGEKVDLKTVESYTKQMKELLDENKDGMFQKDELRNLLI